MSDSAWTALLQYSVPGVLTLAGVWLTSRRTDKKVSRAIELSEPTGNGFAEHVLDELKVIKTDVRETKTLLVQHLADHAAHDLTRSNR